MKKKGRGFPEYKKKQALSILKNRMTFKLELKLMKSLHRDYNQRKERCTLKLKKQDCLQSLSMRERDTLLHKELKKRETSHSHKLNRGLTCLNISRTWESESEGVIPELTARSSKRDAKEELVQESSKRQKTGESSELVDYEWYEALEESELKDEALRNKSIMEGFIKEDDDESCYEQMRRWNIYTNYDDAYEINHDDNERKGLCEVHELPMCNIRRYMMIKYSFNNDEKYLVGN
ncbi:hypothetical protein Tco_0718840 [Tanacetum coccineum]